MTEIADRYRRNAESFEKKVAAVPPDAWANPSPCADWAARDVVRHVVDTSGMFLGFIGEELGDIPSVDDDPVGAFHAAHGLIQANLDDPDKASIEFEGFTGRQTFEASVNRFLCLDLPIHEWDLPRAAGLDETIDPAEVQIAMEAFPQFGAMMRSSGAFGEEIEPVPGADDQTRMLNFIGRQA